VIILFLLALFPLQSVSPTPQVEVEDNIREAVLTYMFEHAATQQHPLTDVFFIAINKNEDPSDKFMKRFEGHKPVVKKLNQSTYKSDTGLIVDKETGRGGIRYSVREVKWINEKEARLEGSYYVAMLFAGDCEYRIVLEGSKWVVKGCEGGGWES
jgi:hypothetical protein